MPDLSLSALRQLLAYDPSTGLLTWRVKRNGRNGGVRPGDPAGVQTGHGHIAVGVLRRRVLAHRLAWFIHYGEWPKGEIDHIDGNPVNNQICNLRDVSHAVNMQNRKARSLGNASTGLLGASLHKRTGKFAAYVHDNSRKVHIGLFGSAEQAHSAHVEARRRLYEGNTL